MTTSHNYRRFDQRRLSKLPGPFPARNVLSVLITTLTPTLQAFRSAPFVANSFQRAKCDNPGTCSIRASLSLSPALTGFTDALIVDVWIKQGWHRVCT
jgi:hypothetical protein